MKNSSKRIDFRTIQLDRSLLFSLVICLVALSLFVITGCRNTSDVTTETPPVSSTIITGMPVETRDKVAPSQQPAFAGQTRIGSVRTQTTFRVSTIVNGLNRPWSLDFFPDGRMIVTERRGTMRIVSPQGNIGNPIQGLPPVRSGGDGGLLDVKLDPDFVTTREVFWSYVESVPSGGVTAVAKGTLSTDETRIEGATVIYRSSPAYASVYHSGGRMLFDGQGRLYVSFGDRFDNAIRMQAQSLGSTVGKIIRINKDGSAAAGNPFITTSGALPEIFSLGHRHPQGLALHPTTGDLWASEHGAQSGDEINFIQPGANYGWPVVGYGLEVSGQLINGTGLTQQSGMEQPVYYWDPAIAPSGMMFYNGTMFREWQNNLFVAALRGAHLIRLVLENNRVVGEERLLTEQNQRIRHVVQATDGSVYLLTDETRGQIMRISRQ